MTTASRTTSTSIRTLPLWAWRLSGIAIVLVLLSYLFALPIRYMNLLNTPALTPTLATIQLILDYLLIAVTSSIGLFLAMKRYTELIAVFMSLTLIISLPNITGTSALPIQLHAIFHIAAALAVISATPVGFITLLSMPDGNPHPRKLLWVIPLLVIYDIIRYSYIFIFPPPNVLLLRPFLTIPNFILIFIALIAMYRRYRYHATLIQRQQFKWLFWGLTIEVGILIVNQAFRLIIILIGGNVAISQLIVSLTSVIGGTALCVALLLAISRYGLWDVDLTINRSVVAGFVTVVLMVIFGVIFWIAQSILTALLGESRSEIAVAVSALVIGISFNPVRKQIRKFVDRRLYGFRFDLNQLERHHEKTDIQTIGALTGQTISGYTLKGVLGRGNMGEVYLGMANNQTVAIKIMQSHHTDDKTMRQRFEREGKITLDHPHIVKTIGTGEENGLFYLVMDYIHGKTLKEWLHEREHFALQDIQHHLHALADAIDYAHAQGYVHRDIKPSNIMLYQPDFTQRNKIMLMDFGIAKFLGDTTSLTGSAAVGTIDYMAPEQIKDSTTVDYRADIYALGIVLYETLTGVLPFKGNLAQVLFAHVNQPAPDIRQLRPDLPASVSFAIHRALQKDPDDRFQTAKEFVDALISSS